MNLLNNLRLEIIDDVTMPFYQVTGPKASDRELYDVVLLPFVNRAKLSERNWRDTVTGTKNVDIIPEIRKRGIAAQAAIKSTSKQLESSSNQKQLDAQAKKLYETVVKVAETTEQGIPG